MVAAGRGVPAISRLDFAQNSRKRLKRSRWHSAHGRCPAARAVASSRKNNSVYRPGVMIERFRPLKSSRQIIHRLPWNWRRIRLLSSCKHPRFPVRVPRADVAIKALNGVTRFCLGILGLPAALSPSIDKVHLVAVLSWIQIRSPGPATPDQQMLRDALLSFTQIRMP